MRIELLQLVLLQTSFRSGGKNVVILWEWSSQYVAEDKRNYFSILNDNRFPIHWFRTSVTAGNTYKFTSESRSSSKSLGRKSKQFFEMSNEISNCRPRKVSLWSVDRRLTDKSLWVVSGSHVVERKYKKKDRWLENKTRFNSTHSGVVINLRCLVINLRIWGWKTYMWLMSIGIDWVAGTLCRFIRKQLICLSDGKHLK